MIKAVKKIAHAALVRLFPGKMGYTIKPKGEGYFNAKTTIKLAHAQGVSVPEFLESTNHGGVGIRREAIMESLKKCGVLNQVERIVEIGAGTGMYVEKFLEACKPNAYEIYETDRGWSNYLAATYASKTKLIVHNASGDSLHETSDNSADIVSAHGVFVYLPVVITFQYVKEAVRVCKKYGYLIFDCFTDRIFTIDEVYEFRKKNPHYDFPVIITEQMIDDLCIKFNLKKVCSFDVNYHETQSTYFILQKQ